MPPTRWHAEARWSAHLPLQVVSLLYYLMSYFPGGTQGVKFMLGLFWQALQSCFSSVQRMVLK